MATISYVGGRRHGVAQFFGPAGQKIMVAEFARGRLHGKRTEWYQDGLKWSESQWKHGKRDGLEQTWTPFGVQRTSGTWSSGRRWQGTFVDERAQVLRCVNGVQVVVVRREKEGKSISPRYLGVLHKVSLARSNWKSRLLRAKAKIRVGMSYREVRGVLGEEGLGGTPWVLGNVSGVRSIMVCSLGSGIELQINFDHQKLVNGWQVNGPNVVFDSAEDS